MYFKISSDENTFSDSQHDRQRLNSLDEALIEIENSGVDNRHDVSIFTSFINLLNTVVGAGMLGLPYAFAKTGWVLGSVLMVVGCSCSIFSLHLLSICAKKGAQPSSFFTITHATLPRFTFLIDLAVVLQCFGIGIAYLLVIGGLMPQVMSQAGATHAIQDRLIWVIIGFAVVAPISFFDNLSKLNFTSTLSIIFVALLTIIIFLYAVGTNNLDPCLNFEAPDGPAPPSLLSFYSSTSSSTLTSASPSCQGSTTFLSLSLDSFRVFSIFIFAFSCQQNIFPVVNQLRDPSQPRINFVIFSSIFAATLIYAVVAICGYATYGDKVEDNILLNYPDTALTSVTRVFVSLLVAFSYPLQCLPARSSMLALWRRFDPIDPLVGILPELPPNIAKFRYIMCTSVFLLGSFGVAMSISDLSVILGLVGATGGTITSYILPGMCYYYMHRHTPLPLSSYSADSDPSLGSISASPPRWKSYAALALSIFGVCIMPICVIFIFV